MRHIPVVRALCACSLVITISAQTANVACEHRSASSPSSKRLQISIYALSMTHTLNESNVNSATRIRTDCDCCAKNGSPLIGVDAVDHGHFVTAAPPCAQHDEFDAAP